MSQPDREPEHVRCYGNSAGWAVVQSHPQAERWADVNLRQQGYHTILPLCVVLRRDRVLRTMTRRVEVPLWPGYLLVFCERRDVWRPIRETPGVYGVLHNGNGLQYVPDVVLSTLQQTEAERRTLTPADALGRPLWAPGAPCRLDGGAFSGRAAVVLRIGTDMAVVALPIFGMVREVIVGLGLLAPRGEMAA